jgi:ubiquinone biosynthesis protein COQ4
MIGRLAIRSTSSIADIIANYKHLPNETARVEALLQNMLWAFKYPHDGEYLSTYGECSSYYALVDLQKRMQNDPVGSQILREKPRIRNWCFDFDRLKDLPSNTVGNHYWKYMTSYNFHPEHRPLVKHLGDLELAYIFQWYKEIHDFLHVLLNKSSTIIHELEVKWFEFEQLGLASCAASSIFGSLLVPMSQKVELFTTTGPEMIRLAKKSKLVLNVYWPKHMEDDVDDFRRYVFND